ncbi:LysM peptidoglycan-binding domain-containing protein [Dyella acidiphila]|uniref:LysM peptidoglycan-binding domain-containing protein n=1 Tax=Dyella acidiphila TaxID=2775866 RepID=A0ABR9GBK8_9GAMM|nr:LysM peptidoglycan-binding domain-containing protein [Dyella acidiphila]MBE1161433.1 LysM peptidoglycan-binding domain-containing protein [Dyella acidiphila]
MFPVSPGSSAAYVPPPQPTPSTYQVQPHDTVQSIAQSYSVTPEELARANGIAVGTTLSEGQTLTLPPNAVPPPPKQQLPSNQSLQQQTDAAVGAYKTAVAQAKQALQNAPHNMGIRTEISEDNAASVNSAQQTMDTAIQHEIAGEIANRNNGVPPQFRTPTDQLIASFGQSIAQRYASDPDTQAAVTTCVSNYQLQNKASTLIAAVPGSGSAQDKLQSLSKQLQGQPQNVVDQVLADAQVKSWIQAEANQVAQPYAQVKPDAVYYAQDQATAAANQLETATTGLSPELATAVTQASMPTLQKIAQLQLGYAGSMVPFDSVQSVLANLGSSDNANAVVQQVADAYAGNLGSVGFLTRGGTTSELENSILDSPGFGAAGNPNFAIAFGNALQARGQSSAAKDAFDAGAQGVQDYLANNGNSPLKAYDAAHSAAEDKDKTLAQLLAQSGPLTYAQQQAFIKAYRSDPDNAKVYQADATAAKTLATYMQNNQSALLYAAGHNQAAAQQLYSCMQDLVQSGQGKVALQFAGYVQNDAAASKAFGKFSDYQSSFLPDAVKAAEGELLVEHNGDTKSAASELLELADPVFKGRNGWNQVKEGFEALANGDTKAFTPANFAEGYKAMGASGKAWAVAAITVDSINGANAEQINETINAFSMAGGDVSEVGTGVLQVMADAGKFGAFNASAEAMARLGSRFVPGLAMVASTSAFASDLQEAKNNTGSAGGAMYALAIAGDVLSVMGSFMENFPPAAVAGEVVSGIGTLISAPFELVGHILVGNKEQQEFQEEQVKYLQAAGISDKEEAEAMAKDGGAINAFASQLGLNAQQAQDILVAHPEAFGQGSAYTQGLINVLKACQIKPADANGFLSALQQDNPNYLNLFFAQNSSPANNPAMPLSHTANLVNLIGGGGFAHAKAYVQSHSPEVFSPDGDARRQADYDYELAQSSGSMQPAQIGNLLKSNHNAAYQAEIISIMKNNGSLDAWVEQMGNAYAYNGWPQAATSALQNAQSAGVLSADQTQQYIGELG